MENTDILLLKQVELTELVETRTKLIKYMKENQELKIKLNSLNENTIVQSMNDMKAKYDELMESTVSINAYIGLKDDKKNSDGIITTISHINLNLKEHIDRLQKLIMHSKDTAHLTKEFMDNRIDSTLEYIDDKLELIIEIINSNEDSLHF